jgi:hypothetical protein
LKLPQDDGRAQLFHPLPQRPRRLATPEGSADNPAVATEYAQLKQRLAAAHPHDLDAYMDGKDAFIKETETQAQKWAATRPPHTPPV